jgi:PAS domain S-box-containing protein
MPGNVFGEYIRNRRQELLAGDKKYSIRKLAERLDVKPSYLSRVERGQAYALSEDKTVALARELGEDPDLLLALSGKVSSDVQEVIRKRPALFAHLVREFKDLPDRAIRADKEYRLVESRLNQAQRMAKIGSWEKDFLSGELYFSDELYRMYGYKPGEFNFTIDYALENHVHPEDRERAARAYYHELPMTGKIDEIYRFYTKNGELRYGHAYGLAEFDQDGRMVRASGTNQDITQSQLIEQALRESEERYRAVVEDQTEVISRFKADGTFLFVNDVYCRFFGKTREELLGNRWHPVAEPQDLPMIEEKLAHLTPDNPVVVIENRVYSGSGEVRWMQFVNRAFYDASGELSEIQSVGRDVTEHRLAEERYRLLAENTDDVITLTDENMNDIYVSPSIERLLGYEAEEFLNLPRERFISESSLKMLNAAVDTAKKLGVYLRRLPCNRWELDFISKENCLVHVEMLSTILHHEDGRFRGILNVIRDITERKRAEKKLTESEEHLRTIFDTVGDMVFIHDENRRILEVNSSMCRLLGYQREELLGMHISVLRGTPDIPRFRERVEKLREQGRLLFESVILTKQGNSIPIEVDVRRMKRDGKDVFLAVCRDLRSSKHQDRNQAMLYAAFEAAGEALALADSEGNIIYSNALFERMAGSLNRLPGSAQATAMDKREPFRAKLGALGPVAELTPIFGSSGRYSSCLVLIRDEERDMLDMAGGKESKTIFE